MDALCVAPSCRVEEWLDSLCKGEETAEEVIRNLYSDKGHIETPLCDRLVALGVLPQRQGRPWARNIKSVSKSSITCAQPNSTETDSLATTPGLPPQTAPPTLSPVMPSKIGLSSDRRTVVTCTDADTHNVYHRSKQQDRFPAKGAVDDRPGWPAMDGPTRSSQVAVWQYLSFVNGLGNVFLACSTTLAAFSADILTKTKQRRGTREKEFVDYFDVV